MNKSTRGNGILEPFLASQRAKKANHLIPSHLRDGRILDIGCGTYPYFLSHTSFKEKFAIDQSPQPLELGHDIQWLSIDIESEPHLPYEDEFFQAVTMLAVAEHLNPLSLISLFQEANRVLVPGGVLAITTPAAWSNEILKVMARLSLVSKEEIDEHVFAYTLPLLGWSFGRAGFEMAKIKFGYFELWLNLWAVAEK